MRGVKKKVNINRNWRKLGECMEGDAEYNNSGIRAGCTIRVK
jgi:hypothetical protein